MISGPVQLIRNSDGQPNLQYNHTALHSARGPVREASRQASSLLEKIQKDSQPADSRVLTLIVGLGWGYVVEEIARLLAHGSSAHASPARLCFYEPIAGVIEQWRDAPAERGDRHRELKALFPDQLLVDPAALQAYIKTGAAAGDFDRIQIEITPTYRRLFPQLEQELTAIVSAGNAATPAIDQDTAARFFLGWGRNFARRMTGEPLRFLQAVRIPAEVGVLYCGAGPDLIADLAGLIEQPIEQQIDQKNDADLSRSAWYIIAADTALAPLLAHGIKPDLLLSVDSGPGTEYHFRAAERLIAAAEKPFTAQMRLPLEIPVLTWSAGPACLPLFFQNIYYYRSTLPFDQLIGAGPLHEIPEWRNLSRNTMGLALLLTQAANHDVLFTAGADFSGSAMGQSHVTGTGYTDYGMLRGSRLSPLSSYRPGGYGRTLSAKNRATVTGLTEMAADLGLTLQNITNFTDNETKQEITSNTTLAQPSQRPGTIDYQEIDPHELRRFLIQTWSSLPLRDISEATGVSPTKLRRASEKWFTIIKNGGQ